MRKSGKVLTRRNIDKIDDASNPCRFDTDLCRFVRVMKMKAEAQLAITVLFVKSGMSKDSVETRNKTMQSETRQPNSPHRAGSLSGSHAAGSVGPFCEHRMTYGEKLKDPRWQKLRLEVMERDDWKCRVCFSEGSTLAVHHQKYTGANPWDADPRDLVTLCEDCHTAMHNGSLETMRPLVSSFYKAVTQARLANDSKTLIHRIEVASKRFLSACDEMELAIVPLQARLLNLIEKEATR